MQANQMKSLINIGLIIAFIGLLIAFPFKDHVIGGILFAIFSAAVIGGLADSFAVKAIFGQPLNIKWPTWLGTNIVARHRERLVDELVNMVQNELLSPESIRDALQDKKISSILQNFLISETGQQTVKQLLQGSIREIFKSQNVVVIIIALKRLAAHLTEKSEPSKHIATILNYIFKEKIDDTIASFIMRLVKPLLDNDEFKQFIKEVIQTAISKYELNNRRRQVANQIANIDANQLTEKLFQYANNWVYDFISDDHPLRIKIKNLALQFITKIESDAQFAAKVDDTCHNTINLIIKNMTNNKSIKDVLLSIEQALENEDATHFAVRWSETIVSKLQAILENTSFTAYDNTLLNWLLSFFESKKHMIGNLVNEKLNQFSTEELITLVEQKAGRDLQYIRLNGTVIGGLIGGFLFLVQFIAGGGQ